jgi:hypothetical protein
MGKSGSPDLGATHIKPLPGESAFDVGSNRCDVIGIVAYKNKPHGKDKLTLQRHILKILSRHGIRIDRRSTSFPDAQYTWRSSRRQLVFHAVARIGANTGASSSSAV